MYSGIRIKLNMFNFCLYVAGKAFEDQCLSKPCKNGGECIQIKYGRYKCDCQGTKHHGENCESGKNKTFYHPFIMRFPY